jgi:class 3 adenylate cyclase
MYVVSGAYSHLARAGAPIAATESRTVALLATDIVGFTTLSADIGAEEVVAMLDA